MVSTHIIVHSASKSDHDTEYDTIKGEARALIERNVC